MCDYSAESSARRDAIADDHLKVGVISRQHKTRGMISNGDTGENPIAVCLKPGTKLELSEIPLLSRPGLRLGFNQGVVRATFAQKPLEPGKVGFRDGVIFEGRADIVLFQEIPLGTKVRVISIPDQEALDAGNSELEIPTQRLPEPIQV